jgi:hypothetical protein
VLTERESTGLTGEEGLPLWRTFNFWFAALLGVTGMIYLFF